MLTLATAQAADAPAPASPQVAAAAQRLQQLEADLAAAKQALAAARIAELSARQNAPPDVTTPQLAVPRLLKPPVIDGRINADEWAGAAAYPAGTGASNQGAPLRARPASVFFIAWDAENLYLAQRMPLRNGEMPVRLNRRPQHDLMDPWETVVEAYIDRKANGSNGLPCRYQFMGNACGNRWDREDQYSIGQNMVSWNGEWQYQQSVSADGKYWESEMAFPRKTVYQPTPLKDGDRWQIGFAASLQHPWQWSGFYGWPITATFRDEVPSVRVFHPERGVMAKRLAFDVEVVNTLKRPLAATAVVRLWDPSAKAGTPALIEKRMPVSLEPGKTFQATIDEDAAQASDAKTYRMTFMLLANDVSLYTWSLGVRYNDIENKVGLEVEASKAPFALTAAYYPLANRLKVGVDKYDVPQRDQVKRASFSVTPKGGGAALGQGDVTVFAYEQGDTLLELPADLKPGTYVCTASLLDAADKVLATHEVTFERKDHAKEFPWLNNTIGEEEVVSRLFQPLELRKDVLCGFRKEIRLTGSALPASIQAADIELLAAPVQLRGTAGGQPFTLEPVRDAAKKGKCSPATLRFTGAAAGGPLKAEIAYALDYDGTARVEVVLAPAARTGGAQIDSLQLVIPFRGEAVTHFMVNGSNMRGSNRAGRLAGAGKTGTVWKSTEMPGQKMTVGSFVPIVHLGNLNSGLTWFADSDRGWWPSDKKPAIEIVRTPQGTVELVLNLAAEPVTLDAPRSIVFGLCTVPVRKVTPFKTSSTQPGFGYDQESGRWDPKVTPERVYARLYPDDPVKYKAWSAMEHSRDRLSKPYTEQSSADLYPKEYGYFANEWTSLFCPSANDNRLYWTEKFIKECDLDGYYFDNIFCREYTDPLVTNAYRLPDGRVQPGFDLWWLRDYLRRLRVTFEKYRDPVTLCIHNTDFQFAPVVAYADLAMGGENPLPGDGTPDFMDMWPREWMDVMMNQNLWGYSMSHLYHYGGMTDAFGEPDRERSLKGHRTTMASMLVHGVPFFQGLEYKEYLKARFDLFTALPGETEFIPSWAAAGRFKSPDPDVDVAVYRKDNALLIIAANYAKQGRRTELWFDFPKLLKAPGKLAYRKLVDLETFEGPGYIVKEGGVPAGTIAAPAHLSTEIAPRDFRIYLLFNAPAAQGAGF